MIKGETYPIFPCQHAKAMRVLQQCPRIQSGFHVGLSGQRAGAAFVPLDSSLIICQLP